MWLNPPADPTGCVYQVHYWPNQISSSNKTLLFLLRICHFGVLIKSLPSLLDGQAGHQDIVFVW